MDELDELYRIRAARDGVPSARRWYRGEVMACAVRLPLDRGRRRFSGFREATMGLGRRIRQTLRGLMRAPGFTAVAVVTLALGIGANATIIGLADRALLRPLPYPRADELVAVMEGWSASQGTIATFQSEMRTVRAIGGARGGMGLTLESPDGPPSRVVAAEVNVGWLDALAVEPVVGRRFSAGEETPGSDGVVLLAHGFATERFGSPAAALGEPLVVDGRERTVIGVMPPSFDQPSEAHQLWIPVPVDPSQEGLHWGLGSYSVLARMAPGVTPDAVKRDLLAASEPARLANPLWTPPAGYLDEARVTSLAEARARFVRTPLLVLLGAVGVVLLVVSANVANLLLSRGLSRRHDRSVRVALGAGRARLVGDQLLEVGLLTGLGALLGLALAAGGLAILRPWLPPELPGATVVGIDLRLVLLTLGVGAGVAGLAAVVPALRAVGTAPAEGLREGGARGSGTRRQRGTVRLLVAGQMAAAVVLVAGAGLLGRSLVALQGVDPGFVVEGRVTLRVDMAPGVDVSAMERVAQFDALKEGLSAAVGGAPVALASTIPFGGETERMATFIPGVTPDPNMLPSVHMHRVGPDYFEVAGIRVLEGRGFTAGDVVGTERVAVVDETFARTHFPDGDVVGRVVRYPWRGAPDLRIVGVVAEIREGDLASPPEPTLWLPLRQMDFGILGHVVAVAPSAGGGGPAATLAALSDAARAQDPRIAVSRMAAYEDLLQASTTGARLLSVLLALFAVTTLALGAVGVYGVAAFSVRERLREIGVRMTLGADPAGIQAAVFRDGLRLALPGGIVGLLLAIPAARLLDAVLFGVSPLDPLTFIGTPILLLAAALLAVVIPARRATRVDPARILREG